MAIGYCCVVHRDYARVEKLTGDLTDSGCVTAAEIEALAIGVAFCPQDGGSIFAYSDVDWLPPLMSGLMQVSFRDKIEPAVAKLREAAAGRNVFWRLVDTRNLFYRECHQQSRIVAVEAARRRGTFGKHPIGYTPSATRRRTTSWPCGGVNANDPLRPHDPYLPEPLGGGLYVVHAANLAIQTTV